MELIKIINARQVLNELAVNETMGSNLAYWVAKFLAKTEQDYEFYISESRKLLMRYAHEEEGRYVINPDKAEEFNDLIDELSRTEAEDPGIRFKLSEMSSWLKLSVKQMYPLLDFIDEEL